MKGKWSAVLLVCAMLVTAVGLGLVAWAGPGKDASVARAEAGDEGGRGPGHGERRGRGGKRGTLLHGELTSVSAASWTIHPELPPGLAERAAAKGRELPELPDSITVAVAAGAKFYLAGAEAQAGDFKAGDKVVIKLDKPWKEEGASIQLAADPESARDFIRKRMDERGKAGRGGPAGPGGRHGKRAGGRVAFGTVTAINADSITIKPEVPQFLRDWLAERAAAHGRELPEKLKQPQLPEELSFSLNGETRFAVDCCEQTANPFKVGDKVGILPSRGPGGLQGCEPNGPGGPGPGGKSMVGPPPEGPGPAAEIGGPGGFEGPPRPARIVSDYASAEQRLEELKSMRQERGTGKKQAK
jgi:hypothetical protein